MKKPKYFTAREIKRFKQSSINFPLFLYDGLDENNVVEVWQFVHISGMRINNGLPLTVMMIRSVKGEEPQRLTYRLVRQPKETAND